MRLGPDVRIVAADDPTLLSAGPDVARRILARYGEAAPTAPG